MTTNQNIMVVTSLEDEDHITAYSDNGIRLWDQTFYPKIISWKLKDGYLYVFSKSRLLSTTYLTCMNPMTGIIIWEKP
jgi:hypothetical protein